MNSDLSRSPLPPPPSHTASPTPLPPPPPPPSLPPSPIALSLVPLPGVEEREKSRERKEWSLGSVKKVGLFDRGQPPVRHRRRAGGGPGPVSGACMLSFVLVIYLERGSGPALQYVSTSTWSCLVVCLKQESVAVLSTQDALLITCQARRHTCPTGQPPVNSVV